MIGIAIAFLLGLGIGLSTVVLIAWLEVWQGAKVKDRYVGLPNQVAVPIDNWMAWIKEKDETKAAEARMTPDEVEKTRHDWLVRKGYRP